MDYDFLFENVYRFVIDFQKSFWTLITWLQVASLEAGLCPIFPVVIQIEAMEEIKDDGDPSGH